MPRYSQDFKTQALAMLKEIGINKTSRKLRVTRKTLCKWRKEQDDNAVYPKLLNNDTYCLLKKYLKQSAQFIKSILILKKRLDELQNKAIQLAEMNTQLSDTLSLQSSMKGEYWQNTKEEGG